jgi:glucan phosphoethanolaminetransferase (alkaline phosphatase superfamily)
MVQEKFCEGCDQSSKCQEIFRKLGSIKGPSFTLKVIVAFLLPLIVFIVSLAIFERVFARSIGAEGLRTVISLLMATLVTFVFILGIKLIGKRIGRAK